MRQFDDGATKLEWAIMLLTRPRRERLYGAAWLLLWLSGLSFIWLWSFRQYDPGPISISYMPDTFQSLGLIDWLWLTGHNIAVPIGRMPATVWSTQVLWPGVVGNLMATVLLGWLCRKGWKTNVSRRSVPEVICDNCGYDLNALNSNRCPECGAAAHGHVTVDQNTWSRAMGALLFSVFAFGFSLLFPAIVLVMVLDLGFDSLLTAFSIPAIMGIPVAIWACLIAPLMGLWQRMKEA